MLDILAPAQRRTLENFLTRGTLFAFDYDGTLAPIVSNRSKAQMRDATRHLLWRLGLLRKTAVISGRAREDVASYLDKLPISDVVGNHGCDVLGIDASRFIEQVDYWGIRLTQLLGALEGVEIENKGLSLAIHHRHAPDEETESLIITALQGVPARIIGGKKVINVIPVGLPHKGDAILHLSRLHRTGQYLFVGDDDNDEDVFSMEGPLPGLKIRVEKDTTSSAPYFIDSQKRIDDLLELILDIILTDLR